MNDPYVTCPYDPCHQVPRSRIQRHLIKCQWRNPDLEACPYNATHRYTKVEMRTHVRNCPSKLPIAPEDRPSTTVSVPLFIKPKSNDDEEEEIWDN